jgi:ubiquinone/menaquinone biosynthesis C-methylase UbiE
MTARSGECKGSCDSIAKCDIFEFMAKHVGMTVIHPGGFKATRRLIKALNVTPDSRVIDIACGKGTTAILLAEKYGCDVVAIDIDGVLIEEAKRLTRKKGLDKKITYRVGDALDLPFEDGEFDVALSQAMLVLVDDKVKAIKEAERVVKKGGVAGWLELTWKKEITKDFLDKISNVICAYCMTNVSTYRGWKKTFAKAGIKKLNVIPLDFDPNGSFTDMAKDEGLLRALSISFNIMRNKEIRNRVRIMNDFFKENGNVFGCGIYYFKKK